MSLDIFTPSTKKLNIYSDFHKDMLSNPLTGDLALKINEDSVKEALKNLILTDKGERLFQPLLGCDVRQSLFDNMTPASITVIEQSIKDTINNFEPRVSVVNIEVIPEYDNYRVRINISFYVRNSQAPVNFSVFLERTR